VVNWQLAVGFVSESHDKAQLNWSVCGYLQDVSKTAFVIKALLVCLMCTWNRTEWNTRTVDTAMKQAL
jgi:hypothetical protein